MQKNRLIGFLVIIFFVVTVRALILRNNITLAQYDSDTYSQSTINYSYSIRYLKINRNLQNYYLLKYMLI